MIFFLHLFFDFGVEGLPAIVDLFDFVLLILVFNIFLLPVNKVGVEGSLWWLILSLSVGRLHNSNQIIVIFESDLHYYCMKQFLIAQLLIYDPTRQSPKRKPIEIDIQEAKIVAYYPSEVPLEQKCNTVGMAEGVYSFCHALLTGKEEKQEEKLRGWQTISMDTCTLILSEVQQNIWIFVKLQHPNESKYSRMGQTVDYQDQTFSDSSCKLFMDQLYLNFKLFYGNIRGWVFRQKFQELQLILTSFVLRFEEIFKFQGKLDLLSFSLKHLRMIPLDINSTLKFTYFKNVLQSYNKKIAHLLIYAYGVLAFTSLDKESAHLISNYLFSTGEPYFFSDQHRKKMTVLPQLPKAGVVERFGVIYNSKVLGFEETNEAVRVSPSKSQGMDLLGLSQQTNQFQLFDIFLKEEELPLKINYYTQNSMFFVTLFRANPTPNELIFQNRFYHDNADKFISKIGESIPGLLKPNDPYRFLFHNCATYTGKSTIKQWKNSGFSIRNTFELLMKSNQGVVATSTSYGYWIYGMHRFSRILILLVPTDIGLVKVEEYVSKMTKQYFARAYL